MKLRDHQCVFLRLDNVAVPGHFQVYMARLPAIQAMRDGEFPGLPERIFNAGDEETALAIQRHQVPREVALWDAKQAYQGPQSSLVDVIHKGWQRTADDHQAIDIHDLPMASWTPQKGKVDAKSIGGPVLCLGPFHKDMGPLERRHVAGTLMRTLRAFQEAMAQIEEKHHG